MKSKILTILVLLSNALVAQQYVTNAFFGSGGTVSAVTPSSGETTDILLQPDGKIINCGYVYDFNCNCNYITMFRVDECGNVDSTFGTNGYVVYTFEQRNSGYDYLLESNGKIVVVGTQSISNNSGDQKPFIARFLNNGQPDSTFGTFGTTKVVGYPTYNSFTYVYPLDSGKYLCMNNEVVMRFTNDGIIDSSFGSNGIINNILPSYAVGQTYSGRSLQRSDKKIITVCATYLGNGNEKSPLFMCTDTLGQIDSTFGTNGFAINPNTSSQLGKPFFLIFQSDDKILSGLQNSNESAIVVSRYNTNGSLDTTYGNGGYASYPGSAPFRFQSAAILSTDDLIIAANGSGNPAQFNTIDVNGTVTNSATINGSINFTFPNGCWTTGMYVINDDELYLTSHCGGGIPWHIGRITTTPNPTITQNVAQLNAGGGYTSYQWFFNGNIINGATDSVYTFTQNGNYTVSVVNSSGCNHEFEYTVTTTNIEHQNFVGVTSVFPNPATDYLTIRFNTTQKRIMKLLNATGVEIMSATIFENESKLNTSTLAAGIYLIRIESENSIFYHQFIKL